MKLSIQSQAEQLVLNLFGEKFQLKEVKNALKAYKITSEKMEVLKQTRKELNNQIKEEKEKIESEFDETYNQLREQKLEAEEKIAIAKQDIKTLLKQSAKDNEHVELSVDVHGDIVKIQAQMSMELFLNGKKE